jgi:Xaa-Pro aminopeptidase
VNLPVELLPTDFSAQLYAKRRAQVAANLGPDSIAVLPTAPIRSRNRDNDFPYRHDSYFYYLTGFSEPNAWLVIWANGRSALFCQPRDEAQETWTGYRLGPQRAPQALGIDEAFSVDEINQRMPRLLENCASLWYPFATHAGLETQIDNWLQKVRSRARMGVLAPEMQRDLCMLVDEMRLFKDSDELALMRRAAWISGQGHIRAMQRCAAMLRGGQDVREYHLEAELLHEFRCQGAQFPAFDSIVAAGSNACVLHYRAGDATIEPGKLVLIDAGCEYKGYAGDISRTFPSLGLFTSPQLDLYEVVLAAQDAARLVIRPGARFNEPHQAALRVLTEGLLDLGIIDKNKVSNVDDAIASRAYFPFYMHRTGHWLGMDVHDCGSYVEPGEATAHGQQRTDPVSGETITDRPVRILRPNMVLTIEPGLYIRASDSVPEQFWNTGIRIEDDAVVTNTGCELITRNVPVKADEIEKLMAWN